MAAQGRSRRHRTRRRHRPDDRRGGRRRPADRSAPLADRRRDGRGQRHRQYRGRTRQAAGRPPAPRHRRAPRHRHAYELSERAFREQRDRLSHARRPRLAGNSGPRDPRVSAGRRDPAGRRDRLQPRLSRRPLAERRAGRVELRHALGARLVARHRPRPSRYRRRATRSAPRPPTRPPSGPSPPARAPTPAHRGRCRRDRRGAASSRAFRGSRDCPRSASPDRPHDVLPGDARSSGW